MVYSAAVKMHKGRRDLQDDQTGPNDLVKAVDKLLNEIGPRFEKTSKEIFAKCEPHQSQSLRLDR